MVAVQRWMDKCSIGLSLLCTVHCLLLPILLVLLPSVAFLSHYKESIHLWGVVCVLPISIYALMMGCAKHKHYYVFFCGFAGLSALLAAVLLGEDNIGEAGEKILTVAGAILIACGHYLNMRMCAKADDCPCDAH